MSTKPKGDRGAGRIYQRGRIWWIQYCHRGNIYRESSHSENEKVARRLLRTKLGKIAVGGFQGPKVDKTTFEEMKGDIQNDYKVNGRKSISKINLSISHLGKMFDFDKMIDITTDRIKAYIVQRQDEKASNATINRELSCLGRMFTLGLQAGRDSCWKTI